MNIASLLVRAGRSFGERPALALGADVIADYRELAHCVIRLAGGLRACLALVPNDRVALVMTNTPAYIEALFACWHAGLVAVPINARLHPREIAYIVDHAEARVVLASADLAHAIAGALPQRAGILPANGADYARLRGSDPLAMQPRAGDDLAWLFYTSGTTGRPKGAMLSHRNLLAMTLSYFVDVDRIAPGDSILHVAPLSHGSGMYVLPHVAAAARHVIPNSGGFDPEEVFSLIAAHPGASFFAAPTMVRRLVEAPAAAAADTRNLKTIVYGGGPMYTADLQRALAAFGNRFAQIYGQGESPMTITALSKDRHAESAHPRHAERLASVGVAQSVVEVIVADADDRPLPAGGTGEVLVRGETVMLGYWRDEPATATALRGGWLHTGDVGVLDADGFLTLKDRSKDLIISGGSNIYPREVEEVLLRHPAVAEAAVIGSPDADWGEVVVAFVVPAGGGQAPSADALDAWCLGELARFKRPKRYRFVAALPKNNYGKVLKTELRRILAEEGGS
jgi:long-chain acyl-CoA synthetase